MNQNTFTQVQKPFQILVAERNAPERSQPYFLRWAMTWLAKAGKAVHGEMNVYFSRRARKERGGNHAGK